MPRNSGPGPSELRRQLAYEAIRTRILSGEYSPGAPLSEVELGQGLQISRTPVREALMRLQEEGLVEVVPRRGPVVRLLAPHEMHEVLLVREALEGLAARMAATKISVATVKGLRTDWQELQAAVSESTLEIIDKKSKDFHSTIIEAAQNRTLARLLESIRGRIEVSRQLYLKPKGKLTLRRAQLSCEEHLAIIDALEVADADRAEEFMRRHLRALMEEILGEAVRHS